MKISFFQFLPKYNQIKKNLSDVKELLKNNKKLVVDSKMIVFPEYFLSGPQTLDSFKSEYKKLLENIDIKTELRKISEMYPGVVFVFGSFLDCNKETKNSSYVIKSGKVICKYSKKALIYNEVHICTSDNLYPTFEIDGKKVGIAVCWDTILPEVFRKYTNIVDLVVIPSFWGIGGNSLQSQYKFSLEKKYYRSLLTTRAYENSTAILFVNSVGKYSSPHYTDRMMGGSVAVLPPLGEIYFTNNKKSDVLHTIDIDFNELSKYREYYATDKDYEFYKSKKVF